ncbi:hypothetical protein HZS_6612 [Henneguya salminicola]|nr:hypothetical protein HZS_6612 [Henneguya salminicola]
MSYSCFRCKILIQSGLPIVYANGKSYHSECFLCCFCFRPFSDSQYFEINEYLFCFEDYKNLFAPICSECGIGIVGKVVKAVNSCWHAECFKCYYCKDKLQTANGCTFHHKKICCKECSKTLTTFSFICNTCNNELSEDTEESGGKLFCRKCYDLNYAVVCDLCKKSTKKERSIVSNDKNFHYNHFCCTKCGTILVGKSYYLNDKLPYCEEHFREFFGKICCMCKLGVIEGESLVNERIHCRLHCVCYICLKNVREKITTDLDGKPLCRKCFEQLPIKVKKNLKDNKF